MYGNQFARADTLKRHPKKMLESTIFKSPNTKEMLQQPTFKIQFNTTWDEMLLAVHNHLPFGLDAQKYLLEELYFNKFEELYQKVLENGKDHSVRIVACFNYINRSDERKLDTIEFNTNLIGESIKQEYLNKVTQPIIQKISEIEADKNAFVLNMCFIKFFFENVQPLQSQVNVSTIQINNLEYEMDEYCNLTFIEEKEDETPGFRHM